MTLVLSCVSKCGIAFAADSAVTNGPTNQAIKIFRVPQLKAGAVCWGKYDVGPPGKTRPLPDFLTQLFGNVAQGSLADLAGEIRTQLETSAQPRGTEKNHWVGVVLIGYVSTEMGLAPELWHIHSGVSEVGEATGKELETGYALGVNAHQDYSKEALAKAIAESKYVWTRNGQYKELASIHDSNLLLLNDLAKREQWRPWEKVEDLADFLGFEIHQTVALRTSQGARPTVGGTIKTLAIQSNGVVGDIRNFAQPPTCPVVSAETPKRSPPTAHETVFQIDPGTLPTGIQTGPFGS